MDYSVKVYLMDLDQEWYELRQSYTLKLACLPSNTTHKDLKHVIQEISAMVYHIPKSPAIYKNLKFAFLSFESEEMAKKAYDTYYSLKGMHLHWVHPETPLCYLYVAPNHHSNKYNLN